MPQIHIVLVEPRIPQNVGNIARTCAATGAALHLVYPLGFEISDRQLKRAGLDYWHLLDIHYYHDLSDFFAKTSGNYYLFTTKAHNNHTQAVYKEPCYLLFGREDAGLPGNLLTTYAAHCYRLPMRQQARSLNLSNTVAVAVYEVMRQWDFPTLACLPTL